VRLTPFGADLAAALAPICQDLDDVLDQARQAATAVVGTLRVGLYSPMLGGPFMVDISRSSTAGIRNARSPSSTPASTAISSTGCAPAKLT
jgi:hypothetical protein